MIDDTLIALAIMAGIFIYMGLQARPENSGFPLLRLMFIGLGLLFIMSFFYFEAGFLSAYSAPATTLLLNSTTYNSLTGVTTYNYLNVTNPNAIETQGVVNGLSNISLIWAEVMAFVILIYLTVEVVIYELVAMSMKKMEKESKRLGK